MRPRAGLRRAAGRSTRPGGWRCGPICGSSPRRSARPIGCGATARRTGSPPARVVRSAGARAGEHLQPARSWRFVVNFSQPIFDGGQRRAVKTPPRGRFQRVAAGADGTADSGAIGGAAGAGDRAEHASARSSSLRSAAQQAQEVLSITNFAFEAGATTNLEVIDAQRQARDADSAAAVARRRRAARAAGSADGAGAIPAVAMLLQREGAKPQSFSVLALRRLDSRRPSIHTDSIAACS